MKKLLNFKSFVIVTFVVMASMIGCDDDVTVENRNILLPETFFATKGQLESATASLYTHLQTPGLYQRFGYVLPDTFSDEMVPSGDPNFLPSYEFNLTPNLDQTSNYWTQLYNGIAKSNFVLDAEERIREQSLITTSGFTEADADNALGEAYFTRGLHYFLLVKRYGGVPLVLSRETLAGTPRSTEEDTYLQIISDFENASSLLYPKGSTQNGRATRGAAFGMLGKVHLFRKNYAEAKTALSSVTGYSLLPQANYSDNFNESGEFNDESMFEVVFSADNNPADTWSANGEGIAEVTFHAQEYSGWGNARPSQKMVEEFEDDDPRKEIAILEPGDSYGPNDAFTNNNGRIWYKFSQLYENQNIVPEGETNTRFLRYADVILMQAEVENELNNSTLALGFLNQLRTRFDLPQYGSAEMNTRGYPVGNKDQIFEAIVHERMVELCAEQHRFDDLVRWGIDVRELAVDDQGNPRGYTRDVDRFMPIPQVEIDTNQNLGDLGVPPQNNGY